MRLLKTPGPHSGGAREGAAFVAEHFAFDKSFRDSGGVDRDERLVLPVAEIVDSACDKFLAGAALAGNHDRDVTAGDAFDRRENVPHRLAGADEFSRTAFLFQAGRETFAFSAHFDFFFRILQQRLQLGKIGEGLR